MAVSDKERAGLMISILAAMTQDENGKFPLLDSIRTKPFASRDKALTAVKKPQYEALQTALKNAETAAQPHQKQLMLDSLDDIHRGFTGAFAAMGMGPDAWDPTQVCPPGDTMAAFKVV